MQITLLKKDSIVTTNWAGGTTNQIAIYPKDAKYSERNFKYRVSYAECTSDSSDFTPLPEYMRKLSAIKGDISLKLHDRDEEKTVKPSEIFTFDGGERISSTGLYTDFNVMMRKGECDGSLEAFTMDGSTGLYLEEDESACIFLTEGEAVCFGEKAAAFEGFLLEGEGDIILEGKAKGFVAVLYAPAF